MPFFSGTTVDCGIGQLDESCCRYWRFNPPSPCCGSLGSGCDGQICFVGTPTGTCCCPDINYNSFQVNVYYYQPTGLTYSWLSPTAGYATSNCSGLAGITLSKCTGYMWMTGATTCWASNSGFFTYEKLSDAPGDCTRKVPFSIIPKNTFCGNPTSVTTSASRASYTLVETDCSTELWAVLTGNGCGGWSTLRPSYGVTSTKSFCTHCDQCDYVAIIDGLETNGTLPFFMLDGTIGGTLGGAGGLPACGSRYVSMVLSGILYAGYHTIDFDYSKVNDLADVVDGAWAHFRFELSNCHKNDCEYCPCSWLSKYDMGFTWYDQCFGLNINPYNGVMKYKPNLGSCFWQSSCHSGTDNTLRKFNIICRDQCCPPPSGFPFKPKGITDSHNIYLYEFYKSSWTTGDYQECINPNGTGHWAWDYYIWTPQNSCSPLDFQRKWKKCDGSQSLSCSHHIYLATEECLNPCNSCTVCTNLYGKENSLPIEDYEVIYYDSSDQNYVAARGTTNAYGSYCANLPSGNSPWWAVVTTGYCYFDPASGHVITCTGLTIALETSSNCIVHSGACTLCNGRAYHKTLHFTDTFGSSTLVWDGSKWAANDCIALSNACYKSANTGCIQINGYSSKSLQLSCYQSGWKLEATLPYKSCGCASCTGTISVSSGTCSNSYYAPSYTDYQCITGIQLGTNCTSNQSYVWYSKSGDFTFSCKPLFLMIDKQITNESPCNKNLYLYSLHISE